MFGNLIEVGFRAPLRILTVAKCLSVLCFSIISLFWVSRKEGRFSSEINRPLNLGLPSATRFQDSYMTLDSNIRFFFFSIYRISFNFLSSYVNGPTFEDFTISSLFGSSVRIGSIFLESCSVSSCSEDSREANSICWLKWNEVFS